MNHDASKIYQALLAGTAQGAGGSGLFLKLLNGKSPDDIRRSCSAGTFPADPLAELRSEAEVLDGTAIKSLPFSSFKLFDTTGDRSVFQKAYFERRKRLVVYGLLSWLDRRADYISALEDSIWAICDEYSWSLPAHMYGMSLVPDQGDVTEAGILKERTYRNEINLDLFACETGFALAECCAMLEDRLSPLVLIRARQEVRRRIIQSYLSHGGLQKWELMDNNWCAVCAGSIASAAMYLVEDELLLGGILMKLMPAFERFVNSFSPDGACTEGLSYWTYGFGFYVSFADLLKIRSAGRIDMLSDPRCEKIARFQQACYFPGGATLSFSDGSCRDRFRQGLTDYLVKRFPGVVMPSTENVMGILEDDCYRCCLALRDLVWRGEAESGSINDDAPCTVFPDAQWLLCRGEGGSGFAVKGGSNNESHNHNDVGCFVFYRNGYMLLCDLGAGEYTKDYFGERRYEIFCNSSFSHNVPIIDGKGQKDGAPYAARNFRTGACGEVFMDIAPAYDIPALERLDRHLRFDPGSGGFILEDSFVFSGSLLPVTERFLSIYEPSIGAGGITITAPGGGCSLRCAEGTIPEIGITEHRDHEGNTIAVYTIDFRLVPVEPVLHCTFFAELLPGDER
ncbi:heparinase II/III-family protein [Treponema sp. OttesenSCG-928-L16]|nr:heparinase II/III-family protein [Treponema sp. OttesenSCG-928-L16]